MDTKLSATVKANLLSIGSVQIDPALLPSQFKNLATAGPGAGGSSIFFRSGGRRVRLTINEFSPLRAVPEDGNLVLIKGDDVIARGILEHPICHCPEQAYITLSEKCIFDCQFCPVPKMQGGIKDSKKVHQMVAEAYAAGELKAISLTSGVEVSPDKEVQRMVETVKQLQREYDLPIGVSVYPTKDSSERLCAAGACEIKYNVETMDPELFRRACPELSLQTVLDSLENAVDHFGKNKVSSNFIIGLGETDETVLKGLKQLTDRCVIPILRPISPHPLRKDAINIHRPDATRLLKLGGMLREMLDRQSLCVEKSRTMCLFCTGCDLTPHRDI
ncbi:Biotin synthase-related enzyme [Methanosarcina horonobensis HB-1 = JCM 15518]|uniref:Biotin synthase-related enzyme n=1 Tax=Methanosarcina horonobensis HB-1 = JCM 15518 TaxID=1434110 RepID=A0A0E3SA05_9EURY|nr:radical SAM protein [Methanosarcina horonobensis]AKB78469.1 Biotin synthase-related enzyme [Methanosarcina horonobensis HB-1 = JCM 15518]